MTESTATEIALRTIACFLAYDMLTGEVVYVHEVMSDDDATMQCEDQVNITAIRHRVAHEFPGHRLDVIEVPQEFELRQGVSYRVDPVSKVIGSPDEPTSFRDFIKRGLVD